VADMTGVPSRGEVQAMLLTRRRGIEEGGAM
jgi:hypothetical protein